MNCRYCGRRIKHPCKGSCGPECPGPQPDKGSTVFEEYIEQKTNILDLLDRIDARKITQRSLGKLDAVCDILTEVVRDLR